MPSSRRRFASARFRWRLPEAAPEASHLAARCSPFQSDPLAPGVLDGLIAAAALAPSVGNAQPWRFVSKASAGTREALAAHVDAASAKAAASYDPGRARSYRRLKLHGLHEVPAILAVFCDDQPAAGHGLGRATMPEMLRYSTVLGIHTLWLMARAKGIGVGWVSIHEPEKVGRLLDVPAEWSLIAVLCIGYPEQPSAEPELQAKRWQERLPVEMLER